MTHEDNIRNIHCWNENKEKQGYEDDLAWQWNVNKFLGSGLFVWEFLEKIKGEEGNNEEDTKMTFCHHIKKIIFAILAWRWKGLIKECKNEIH